jgi:LDH2 family malate/lactate/ureidoglycolate dehydrogenase
MEHAVALARDHAFVPMVLHEIGHLAALGMFTLRAAEAGNLAFLAQSAPPMMALAGSKGAAIGNNPLSFASPVPRSAPLVLDIAVSGVARGNVLAAAREGRAIPEGWAIDAEGNPTTDANAALAGAMLPMAGHKGIGLAMMVECLAGSLTGATPESVTGAKPGSAPARVGAFGFVANPTLVAGREAYEAHVEAWLERYRRATGPEGRYPGQRAASLEVERGRDGIPLPAAVVVELRKVGELTGAPFDVQPQVQAGTAPEPQRQQI